MVHYDFQAQKKEERKKKNSQYIFMWNCTGTNVAYPDCSFWSNPPVISAKIMTSAV